MEAERCVHCFSLCLLRAGIHIAFGRWRKPFSPILGETWQAQLSDGTLVQMEQISHHPPVSAFRMEGPGTHACMLERLLMLMVR